jgi:hypothetical protein
MYLCFIWLGVAAPYRIALCEHGNGAGQKHCGGQKQNPAVA